MERRAKYAMNPADREHIEHKYYLPEQPHDGYHRFAYHGYDYDPATGMPENELKEGIAALVRSMKGQPHAKIKAEAVKYLLDHTMIDVNEHDYYIGIYSWGRLLDDYTSNVWKAELFGGDVNQQFSYSEYHPQKADPNAPLSVFCNDVHLLRYSGACDSWPDYDHSIPDWDSIMSLGFFGMRERARAYRRKNEEKAPLTEEQKAFYDAIETDLSAILSFIHRLRLLA